MSPYRTPAPPPRKPWRPDRYQLAAIFAGIVFYVALIQLVRVLGHAWHVWEGG